MIILENRRKYTWKVLEFGHRMLTQALSGGFAAQNKTGRVNDLSKAIEYLAASL